MSLMQKIKTAQEQPAFDYGSYMADAIQELNTVGIKMMGRIRGKAERGAYIGIRAYHGGE